MRDEKDITAGGAQIETAPASSLPSSPIPSPSSSIPHPSSPYIARWRHKLHLHFRVWPKYKMTHEAIATMKSVEVNGMRINDDGRAEVWIVFAIVMSFARRAFSSA